MNVVQLEMWQLILLLLAFFGAVGTFGKILLDQIQSSLNARFEAQDKGRHEATKEWNRRFDELQKENQSETEHWHRVETQLLRLQAELPKEYVRREDHIRLKR